MLADQLVLSDILTAKEQRRSRQEALRAEYGTPIISITVNIPGPVKDRPEVRRLCDYAVAAVRRRCDVLAVSRLNLVTGPEALIALRGDAHAIKDVCIAIEEEEPFGRLLDLDVFTAAGQLVSRQDAGKARQCFVCSRPAVLCMRERRHSPAELAAAVDELLIRFVAYETRAVSPRAEKIGALAVEAMLYEVACTPAPGLVDRNNAGAHRDMDFFTFMASTAALSLTMARCAEAGLRHGGSLPELLPVLRRIGREGEQSMLTATRGVNTQKGLLFSLGIVVAAAGWLVQRRQPVAPAAVLAAAAEMVDGIVARELGSVAAKPAAKLTAGERLYRDYGITGIRGEMERGLPAVRDYGLPALRQALAAGLSVNDALVETLMVLMAHVEDTTVMNRHNPDILRQWLRPRVTAFLAAGGMYAADGRARVAALDEEFIAHNVSPGGAADLLAVTWFLHRLEEVGRSLDE
ncbi:Holo-ACP synthase., Triphosphoribosyl-dephospho-CoA synthase [Thermosinus carboxydivorans Nor1]|uniref:Probable 2-(5''-triphosphoribosyl)-3'-dephosphocoenzyme-A synthase n=1 Tax=Thermosinus carboxydivorans Nor1 TaxID=401526 RepID=A1HRP7_9FIRM|nr:triphosphoribosyl-dephospho-CoA synthase CitG [Thermosinus carboxydivorans]EAX47367.1 Holo-ACP synthase., Triphosphoribosyl-dephospho-CoA synthase [Thermosinus carboxydivorans Nor1]